MADDYEGITIEGEPIKRIRRYIQLPDGHAGELDCEADAVKDLKRSRPDKRYKYSVDGKWMSDSEFAEYLRSGGQ